MHVFCMNTGQWWITSYSNYRGPLLPDEYRRPFETEREAIDALRRWRKEAAPADQLPEFYL